jgi:hypothetical protein
MHVAAADAARAYPHQHVVVFEIRERHVGKRERPWRGQQQRFQNPSPFTFTFTRIRYMSAVT